MILALALFGWWLSGTCALIWLAWTGKETFTWKELLICSVLGILLGPLIGLIIALKLLSEAEFWNKPIF